MAVVASETSVEVAQPRRSGDEEWKVTDLYFKHIELYYKEAIVDVVKVCARSSKLKSVPIPSLSNATWAVRDQLQKDPYNLRLINNLGYLYWKEGQHQQCLNVMMRGWKRVGEIPDATVRFHYLMKLAELSMGLWMYRQGLAIFRDIEEPAAGKELKSYLILGTQLWCNNGDLQQSLKFFHRCIEGEGFEAAVRIFAVLVLDMKKAGAYEAARSSVEQLQNKDQCYSELAMLDSFVEQSATRKKVITPDQEKWRFIMLAVGLAFVFLLAMVSYFEYHSFNAITAPKP